MQKIVKETFFYFQIFLSLQKWVSGSEPSVGDFLMRGKLEQNDESKENECIAFTSKSTKQKAALTISDVSSKTPLIIRLKIEPKTSWNAKLKY